MKVGRNDPCPCGSGKKYKKCCYPDATKAWRTASPHQSPAFTVQPAERPDPIDYHMVSSNGGKTWQRKPGLLAVQVIGTDPKDADPAITGMIETVLSCVETADLTTSVRQGLVECVRDVEHKLYAVKYHLMNYLQAESDEIARLSTDYRPPTGVQEIIDRPRLIYEVEAFLFQARSCLDVLSWALKPVFGFEYCSFGEEGDVVVKRLRNNCPSRLTVFAEKITGLIQDAQLSWLVDLVNMRDQVTHYSRLEGFSCFVKDPHLGGDCAQIHYPTMPNKQRASQYCEEVWQKLVCLCRDFLTISVEAAKASK
jgi:hypothetical protein